MAIYILNLIDAVCTLHIVHHGGVELNPILRWLLQWPALFVGYKILFVGALCWWLSIQRDRVSRAGLTLCTAVYAAVCTYHIFILT